MLNGYLIRHILEFVFIILQASLCKKVKIKDECDLLKSITYENQQRKFLQRYQNMWELLKNIVDALRLLDKMNTRLLILTNVKQCVASGGHDLPVTSFVHFIFKQVNSYFVARRE